MESLRIDGVAAERIADAAGTPVFVYGAAGILNRFREIAGAFSAKETLVCYALKANSNLSVCSLLSKAGAGAEVVSGGELRRALLAGFRPGSIVFSGVGKTDDEMRLGLRRGILAFNVESLGEVERLRSMARRLARPAPFAVRINPGVDAGTHAYVTTGTAGTKFGMSRAQALPAYLSSLRDGWLRPVGIHCHIGSQITRIEPYRKALKALASLAGELAGMGVRLDHLDIGGGFGISYGGPEAQLDFRELARGLLPMLRGMPRRLILEPGRSLVGPAGVLLTRVLGRKSSGSREFLVVDAAMNDLVRPALYGARHTVSPVHPRPGRRARFDVVGPVCESADFLAKDCLLAPPEPGDLLAIGQSGAYGFSMSSQYNSRPRACEVLVEGGGFRVIRRRETFLDLVRLERGFLRH